MPPSGELTILLPLRDRVEYTMRWMDYADGVCFPFKVLIADGGSDDRVTRLLADKSQYRNVDYEYVRYPYDRSYADYYAKLVDALARVQTPYVAMADNDDFLIAECLQQSVRFLSRNPDYIACGGQGANFWGGTSRVGDRDEPFNAENIAWKCTPEFASIDANAAQDRLLRLSTSPSEMYFYDVKRIGEARKQFQIAAELNLQDLFLVEDLILFLTAVAGKTKRLERLHIVRQRDSTGSSGGNHSERFGDGLGRMFVETWSKDFSKFVNIVAAELAEVDRMPLAEARNCVIKSYRMSLAPSLLAVLMDEPNVTAAMPAIVTVVRRLVRLTEESLIKRFARFVYRHVHWISLNVVYGAKIVNAKVPHADDDFRSVYEFFLRSRRH